VARYHEVVQHERRGVTSITGPGTFTFTAHSELRAVDEALKGYEEGLEKGHLAALRQVHRDGVVNLALGNLRRGEPVRPWRTASSDRSSYYSRRAPLEVPTATDPTGPT